MMMFWRLVILISDISKTIEKADIVEFLMTIAQRWQALKKKKCTPVGNLYIAPEVKLCQERTEKL